MKKLKFPLDIQYFADPEPPAEPPVPPAEPPIDPPAEPPKDYYVTREEHEAKIQAEVAKVIAKERRKAGLALEEERKKANVTPDEQTAAELEAYKKTTKALQEKSLKSDIKAKLVGAGIPQSAVDFFYHQVKTGTDEDIYSDVFDLDGAVDNLIAEHDYMVVKEEQPPGATGKPKDPKPKDDEIDMEAALALAKKKKII